MDKPGMRKNNSLNIWILNNLNFWGSRLIRYGVVMKSRRIISAQCSSSSAPFFTKVSTTTRRFSNASVPSAAMLSSPWREHTKQRTCACWLKLLLPVIAHVLFDNSRGNQGPDNNRNDNALARVKLKSFCSKCNILMQLCLWNIAYEIINFFLINSFSEDCLFGNNLSFSCLSGILTSLNNSPLS